jgi:hypothetical protein
MLPPIRPSPIIPNCIVFLSWRVPILTLCLGGARPRVCGAPRACPVAPALVWRIKPQRHRAFFGSRNRSVEPFFGRPSGTARAKRGRARRATCLPLRERRVPGAKQMATGTLEHFTVGLKWLASRLCSNTPRQAIQTVPRWRSLAFPADRQHRRGSRTKLA